MDMLNWKKGATFGVIAASLAFSTSAFADQPTVQNQPTTTTSTAVTSQPDQIAQLLQQLNTLQGTQLTTTVNTLKTYYGHKGDNKSLLKVEKDYLKKKFHKKDRDEDILKEYKALGELLRKSGKVGVSALVNGEEPNMDVQPIIENGRTLLPFRSLAESLGAQVSFDQTTSTVTVTKTTTKVVLTLGSTSALVNGQPVALDVPAQVVQGRTLVPLRFLGQSLNAKVLWEPSTQLAVVLGDQSEVVPSITPTPAPAAATTTDSNLEVVPSSSSTTTTTAGTTEAVTTSN
jgi:hypothetical protein